MSAASTSSAARPVPLLPLRHALSPPPPLKTLYFSPRTARHYEISSPRTPREQLELTGAELNDALIAAADLAKAVDELRARAGRQRIALVGKNPGTDGTCPICMDPMRDGGRIVSCSNQHAFCCDCLTKYKTYSRTFLCPLCRVPLPHTVSPD